MKAFLLFQRRGMKDEKIIPECIILADSFEDVAKLFSGSIVEPNSPKSFESFQLEKKDKELHFPDKAVPEGLPEHMGLVSTEKRISMLYIQELPFARSMIMIGNIIMITAKLEGIGPVSRDGKAKRTIKLRDTTLMGNQRLVEPGCSVKITIEKTEAEKPETPKEKIEPHASEESSR